MKRVLAMVLDPAVSIAAAVPAGAALAGGGLDAGGTNPGRTRLAGLIRARNLLRAAVHVICWVPFITTAVDAWRGPWRAVGDNAHLALESWNTFSGRIPLVGQPNELPGSPHDLGPLQYWLLGTPVHIDPARGVLWGAVVLAMLAASLTIEAGYSVLGETGALLAGGVFIAIVTWFPGLAIRPEDNPNFGMIFFIATFSVCLAVLSGHRKWWPVLVVLASIAAQSHLTFAAAAVGLVLMAVITALVDERKAKGSYKWLFAGLTAGAACWLAPLGQQFFSPAGGNISMLLRADSGEQHVGFGFALKAMASLAVPSPLWWQQNISQRHDLFQVLGSTPAVFGLVILAITAVSLVLALWWLRSRELAGLAAVSLLVGVSAAVSFALIPAQTHNLGGQQHDLVLVMFAAVLLAWLTAICVMVLAAGKLIRRPAGRPLIAVLARGGGALLLAVTVLLGAVQQASVYAGAGTNSLHVGAAVAAFERSVPTPQVIALSVAGPIRANRFQVLMGLCWELRADGYLPDAMPSEPNRVLPRLAVGLNGRGLTVRVTYESGRQLASDGFIRPYTCGIQIPTSG